MLMLKYAELKSQVFGIYLMDSEILWENLTLPNFEYYPAGCAILEYGAAF